MSPAPRSSMAGRVLRQADRGRRGLALAAARLDPRPRALPDFLVIGAQKAGTSSLYAQLTTHPSVLPALRKEVHYFDRPPAPPARYRAFFPRAALLDVTAARTGVAITGEATPYYLFHPGVPKRVRALVPEVRLVAVLRDPVARAISGYHHAVRVGDEDRPIDVALDPDAEDALAPASDVAWYDSQRCPARLRGYLARGRYAEQLERWFESFPREQLLVIESGSVRGGRVPADVLEFLDLPPVAAPVPIADRNVGSYAPPDPLLVARVTNYFRPHNARLVGLLGADWGWAT